MKKLPKKQAAFLTSVIEDWKKGSIIDESMAEQLQTTYEARSFDWKRLAAYSFWVAISCGVIAFVALIADDWIMGLIERLFDASYFALFGFTTVIAAVFYFIGASRRTKYPNQVFTNEAILFIGVIFTATAIGFLGQALDTGSGHFSLLLLLSTIVYGALGLWFDSKLIWIFAVVSLGSWFGTETGYISGWGAYFLGMNYPLRFVLFGLVLTFVGFVLKKHRRLAGFHESTYVMGLLYLFISLWLLSIFGNYGDMTLWYEVQQIELLQWGVLFAVVAILTIVHGLKYDDHISRGFGVTFLFINLYTKYFEFFWTNSHKAVFFFIMGLSFWLIGRKAEKVWTMEFLHRSYRK